MKAPFPFVLSSKIVLSQKEYGISSDIYVLSKIADHVDEFGMAKERLSQNELHYMKIQPFRTYRREDIIRNLYIRVDCVDDSILISLKTNVLYLLLIALAGLIGPLFTKPYIFPFHLFIFTMTAILPYGFRAYMLSVIKSELITKLNSFKSSKRESQAP
jgi:hypothetical protein